MKQTLQAALGAFELLIKALAQPSALHKAGRAACCVRLQEQGCINYGLVHEFARGSLCVMKGHATAGKAFCLVPHGKHAVATDWYAEPR